MPADIGNQSFNMQSFHAVDRNLNTSVRFGKKGSYFKVDMKKQLLFGYAEVVFGATNCE